MGNQNSLFYITEWILQVKTPNLFNCTFLKDEKVKNEFKKFVLNFLIITTFQTISNGQK